MQTEVSGENSVKYFLFGQIVDEFLFPACKWPWLSLNESDKVATCSDIVISVMAESVDSSVLNKKKFDDFFFLSVNAILNYEAL